MILNAIVLEPTHKNIGYICVPYKHDNFSVSVKDYWTLSKNFSSIYFVTATFSDDIKPYFPSSTNHYLLGKFNDDTDIIKNHKKFMNDSPSFVFSINDELFERNIKQMQRFVSIYYVEFNDQEAISDISNVIVKKDRIQQAGFAHLSIFCENKPKFTFPYSDRIIILEVADDRSPQSICKYCEKTRQDISRKGVVMNNLVSFSLLEKLK